MSFLVPKPDLPAGFSDNTPGRSATLSPAEVFPLVRGRGRVVARPMTPVLHWSFRNTDRSSTAYFSILYGLCLGPVDEFLRILVNGKIYQGVHKFRDENPGDYVTHVVPKETPERFWLGWGLDDQANQGTLIQSLVREGAHEMTGKVHPRYAGIAWLLVQDMEAGSSAGGKTPPLPRVEVELHCRGITTYSFGYAGNGAHPIGTIRDVLTLKRGLLGLPAGYLDTGHWDAKAAGLFANGVAGVTGTDLWTSHVFDKPRAALDLINDVASYFDGHIRERDGKLQVDWQPNDGSTASPAGLREISLHEMADEPSLEPEDLDQMATQVIVTGLDLESDPPLSEASEAAQVPYSRRLIGESRTVQLNRPGWTLRHQIKSAATLEAAMRANPTLKVRVPVLRQYAVHPDGVTPLRPGDRFTLDWESVGLDVVMRILERSKESATRVEFLAVVERGAFPRPYEPPLDPRAPINVPAPADLTRYVAAQVPPDLAEAPAVAILAERPNSAADGMEVHFAPTNSWPGQVLGRVSRWAVGALLGGAMDAGTGDSTVTVGSTGSDWLYLSSMSALEQSDDSLLMYHAGEWCSVGTITPTGGGNYELVIMRARLGSAAVVHAAGALVFFIARTQLTVLEHANFYVIQSGGTYDETTATKWFKLRPYNSAGPGNLTAAFSLVLRNWWGEVPIIDLGAVPSTPIVGLTYAITGEIADLTGDLVRFSVSLARIVAGEVESEITALSRDVVGDERTLVEFKVQVIFPVEGNWRVIVRAWDEAGNVAEAQTAVFAVAVNTTLGDLQDLIDAVQAQVAALILEAAGLATDLLAEVAAREEAIIDEATAREDADESITTYLEAVTADYEANKATVASQLSSLATENTAQAADITALEASVADAEAEIASVDLARASGDSALAASISSLSATVGGIDSTVDVLSAAYIVGGVAVATWGFKLDGAGKVVGMQAIAASGGVQDDVGVIVFSGADIQSDTFGPGDGWRFRPNGDAELNHAAIRGYIVAEAGQGGPDEGGQIFLEMPTSIGGHWAMDVYSNGNLRFFIENNPGIAGTKDIEFSGDVYADDFIVSSSRELKANIRALDSGVLDRLLTVQGVQFEWSDPVKLHRMGQTDIGVIAEDVERSFPELVGFDGRGVRGVSYHKLVPVLIEAIRELRADLDVLRQSSSNPKNKHNP